jgi:hypothetical protein
LLRRVSTTIAMHRPTRLSSAIAVIVLTIAPSIARAQGGPPLLTDDPDTPGPGYWEINIAAETESGGDERRVQLPILDVNYGVGTRIQLKAEMPWLMVRDGHADAQHAAGNPIAGVKWRFIGAEYRRLAWSTYPQVEFHTAPAAIDDRPGDATPILHLPTEVTVGIATWLEINAEIGRSFISGGADRWFGGFSTEIEAPDGFEIVGELHEDKARGAPSSLIATVGVRPAITARMRLLTSIGRTLHSGRSVPPRFRVYAGLQLNMPRRY